tara:strand:+ start:325 stop:1554 length:1230 start_codon:yes stop_codon:yes gene_type:complete
MSKLAIILLAMASIYSVRATSQTTDYIDIKAACQSLESDSSHSILGDSRCLGLAADGSEIVPLQVSRASNTTDEVESIQSSIKPADLAHLCEEFKNDGLASDGQKAIEIDFPLQNDRKWKVVFTFGPFLSFHRKLKMRLQNENTDVTIDGLEPVQRTGLHHYAVWSDNTEIGKFIDEPQNDFTLELQNVDGKYFFGLRYSHPKTLFQDRHDNPQINSSIDIEGRIGGRDVSEQGVNLKDYIHTLSTSHGNTNINFFGGKVINLAGESGGNNLELRVGAGAGVSFANGVSKYYVLDDNGDLKLEVTENQGMKVYGFNLTGESTLRYNFMQGTMNASLNARGVYTRIDGPMGNFDARGDLLSAQVGVSLGYSPNLFPSKSEKARRRIAEIEKNEEKRERLQTRLEELQNQD